MERYEKKMHTGDFSFFYSGTMNEVAMKKKSMNDSPF